MSIEEFAAALDAEVVAVYDRDYRPKRPRSGIAPPSGWTYRGDDAPCHWCGNPACLVDGEGRRGHPLCAFPPPEGEPSLAYTNGLATFGEKSYGEWWEWDPGHNAVAKEFDRWIGWRRDR